MPRVLVIDDDAVLAHIVLSGLQHQGHSVAVSTDSVAGLEMVRTERPDVVVLDVDMPVMNGWQVLDELTASGVTVPVIVGTARDSVADQGRAWRGGAAKYLVKPYRLATLVAAVAEVTAEDLDQRARRQQAALEALRSV